MNHSTPMEPTPVLPSSFVFTPSANFKNGDIIEQRWNGMFVFFAYCISFIASYAAVRLLEQNLWRTDKERENAKTLLARYPKLAASIILGFGTVWSMHFIGQSAVTLKETSMCYNWPVTGVSLICAMVFMFAGIHVASFDIFSGLDREKKLKDILRNDPIVTSKQHRKQARWNIHKVAYCYELNYILCGATLAAIGAVAMHYTGMYAMKGPFRKVWSVPYVVASAVLAIAVCFVGFWIIFRPLHFKVEQRGLRPAAAATIALAVCLLHFFGMLSVTYVSDNRYGDHCLQQSVQAMHNKFNIPDSWSAYQLLLLCISYVVPAMAFYVEHSISMELRAGYAKLKDIKLSDSSPSSDDNSKYCNGTSIPNHHPIKSSMYAHEGTSRHSLGNMDDSQEDEETFPRTNVTRSDTAFTSTTQSFDLSTTTEDVSFVSPTTEHPHLRSTTSSSSSETNCDETERRKGKNLVSFSLLPSQCHSNNKEYTTSCSSNHRVAVVKEEKIEEDKCGIRQMVSSCDSIDNTKFRVVEDNNREERNPPSIQKMIETITYDVYKSYRLAETTTTTNSEQQLPFCNQETVAVVSTSNTTRTNQMEDV